MGASSSAGLKLPTKCTRLPSNLKKIIFTRPCFKIPAVSKCKDEIMTDQEGWFKYHYNRNRE